MSQQAARRAFTLIEFLIALVIIGFIVTILVGVFSSPLKQARIDSAVSQLRDGFRQVSDATVARQIRTGQLSSVGVDQLVSEGYLTAAPTIPAAANNGDGMLVFNDFVSPLGGGGCAVADSGVTPLFAGKQLMNVPDDFCDAYNTAVGLTVRPKSCLEGGNCPGDQGMGGFLPEEGVPQTFCMEANGANNNTVIYFYNFQEGFCW